MYIKWTTKFKTLTVSINTCPTQGLRALTTKLWGQQWSVTNRIHRNHVPFKSIKQASLRAHTWSMHRYIQLTCGKESPEENNPEYILYTQHIRDPWDLQKQSTFQCMLITTQCSNSINTIGFKILWRQPLFKTVMSPIQLLRGTF